MKMYYFRHRRHEPPYLSSLFLLSFRRTFVEARVNWVRDPYLDAAVERERNLTPTLSLKSLIPASSSSSLPISIASAHKPISNFKFIQRYPTLFKVFLPRAASLSPPHVKLTRQFLTLHREEQAIHDSMDEKELAAQRLVKLLMLAKVGRVVIDGLKFDLVSYYPENFRVCRMMGECGDSFGLELVNWREDLVVSAIRRSFSVGESANLGVSRGLEIRFPMSFSPGFDLQKKVKDWTERWQSLPYISPYENAFHLTPSSDQMEKWAQEL